MTFTEDASGQLTFAMPKQPVRHVEVSRLQQKAIVFLRKGGVPVYRQGRDLIVAGRAMSVAQAVVFAKARGWTEPAGKRGHAAI